MRNGIPEIYNGLADLQRRSLLNSRIVAVD
jgi:hypothetical protein